MSQLLAIGHGIAGQVNLSPSEVRISLRMPLTTQKIHLLSKGQGELSSVFNRCEVPDESYEISIYLNLDITLRGNDFWLL